MISLVHIAAIFTDSKSLLCQCEHPADVTTVIVGVVQARIPPAGCQTAGLTDSKISHYSCKQITVPLPWKYERF